MNQELKQKWIDALRSGEYRQIKGRLNDTYDGYCCLGVLGVVAGYQVVGNDFIKDGKSLVPYNQIYELISPNTTNRCMIMNDVEGKSFNEIADYINLNIVTNE